MTGRVRVLMPIAFNKTLDLYNLKETVLESSG